MQAFHIVRGIIDPTPDSGRVRVAAIQMDTRLGDIKHNLARCRSAAQIAAQEGCTLAVFPECTLTGYCFESLEEAREAAIYRDGEALEELCRVVRETEVDLVVGYLERTPVGVANSVSVLGPDGILAHYQKTHLPFLGADRFTEAGRQPFRVHEVAGLRIGLLICYDASFPEAARLLALEGADLILLPTNWPEEAEEKAEWLPNTRAYENVVYFASVNRIGDERGFHFHGRSRVCDPTGHTMVEGPRDTEAILVCDLDPRRSREKRIVRREGYWVDRIAGRREDLYRLRPATESEP
jgi:predicted amidohydrolase